MYYVGIGIFGLALGSFVNALVWRVWQQSLPKKKRVSSNERLSLSKGRSMCPQCQHELAWYDLVPVISWLSVRGKCRYCSQAIGWQYPLVELATAAVFVISYHNWPMGLVSPIDIMQLGLWLSALVGFMALVVYDLRWMLLPDRIVFPVVGLGSLYAVLAFVQQPSLATVASLAGAVFVSSGIFYMLFQISDGKWIGGGDVKIGIALGLFLGSPFVACLMLFLASLLGIVFTGITALTGSKLPRVVPFGPMLIVATFICVLWGSDILAAYMELISLSAI